MFGCQKDSEFSSKYGAGFEYILGDMVLKQCPISLIKTVAVELELFEEREHGGYPHGGRLEEETAYYRSIMPLISSIRAEAEEFQRKESERKHGKT